MVMAADGRPFVPPFPGSSLEPPRLQLRWSLPEREREGEREKEAGRKKRGHNDLSNWNLPIHTCTHMQVMWRWKGKRGGGEEKQNKLIKR